MAWAFTHVHAANWHPITTLSHMLDVQLYALNPWGHHLTNLILHASTAVFLFLALRQLIQDFPAARDRRFNFWASAIVATLFAIHPLRVESVAWISERKDVLSGLFFAATLLAYARYAREHLHSGRDAPRHPVGAARRPYLATIVLFALGLMCKPTLVTLPFVLLLLDYWPLGRMDGPGTEEHGNKGEARSGNGEGKKRFQRFSVSAFSYLVLEKIPLFVLSAASCVITVIAQRRALEPKLNLDLVQRISNAAVSYVIYLGQIIYPVHLSVSYPYVPIKLGEAILAGLFLAAVTVIFLMVRSRYPFLITGWLWYLGILVPMIGLVQVGLQPHADRYTYLAHIGLYLLLGCSVAALARRSVLVGRVLFIGGLAVVATLIVMTRLQAAFWRDSETLWRHAVETTPANYIAYNNLGTLLLHRNQPEAAVIELLKAIQIKPDFENAYVSAGSAFMLMNRIDEAIRYYQKALQLHPDSAENWSNLATALLKQGKKDEALADYRKAAVLKPNSAEMQFNLGHALAGNNQWVDAIASYRAAIGLQPREAKFHNNLAVALINSGMSDDAFSELHQALQISPNYAEAHYNLGCLLVSARRKEEAAAQFAEAIRLQPENSNAREQLQQLARPAPGNGQ